MPTATPGRLLPRRGVARAVRARHVLFPHLAAALAVALAAAAARGQAPLASLASHAPLSPPPLLVRAAPPTPPLARLGAPQQPLPALPGQQPLPWPCFRGPQRDGVARDASPPLTWSSTENVAWRCELPGPGSSSPIVAAGRVFVTCYSGYGAHLDDGGSAEDLRHHLVCVAADSGEILWERSVPGRLAGQPPQVQVSEHGFATPTPATDGEAVFVYFGRAGLFAFDLDGEQLWHRDLGFPSPDAAPPTNQVVRNGQAIPLRWGAAASPLLHGDLVIVNASEESNAIQAFDRRTGEPKWRRESANLEGCASSPVVVGEGALQTLVLVLGGAVWGLEPATGVLRWSVETGTRGGMSPTPVADGDVVYTFGGEGDSFAIRMADVGPPPPKESGGPAAGDPPAGEPPASEPSGAGIAAVGDRRVLWRGPNLDIPSPVLHDGRLLLVTAEGHGLSVNPANGELAHRARLEGRTGAIYASPVVAADRLYVTSRKRGTFVYSADGAFKLLAHNQLGDASHCNASPAVAGDTLYLRSDKALYGLRSEGQPAPAQRRQPPRASF